jgi:hypothetical protein
MPILAEWPTLELRAVFDGAVPFGLGTRSAAMRWRKT